MTYTRECSAYDCLFDETWHGQRAGKDISATINPDNVKRLLATLEALEATRWLVTADASRLRRFGMEG